MSKTVSTTARGIPGLILPQGFTEGPMGKKPKGYDEKLFAVIWGAGRKVSAWRRFPDGWRYQLLNTGVGAEQYAIDYATQRDIPLFDADSGWFQVPLNAPDEPLTEPEELGETEPEDVVIPGEEGESEEDLSAEDAAEAASDKEDLVAKYAPAAAAGAAIGTAWFFWRRSRR